MVNENACVVAIDREQRRLKVRISETVEFWVPYHGEEPRLFQLVQVEGARAKW